MFSGSFYIIKETVNLFTVYFFPLKGIKGRIFTGQFCFSSDLL